MYRPSPDMPHFRPVPSVPPPSSSLPPFLPPVAPPPPFSLATPHPYTYSLPALAHPPQASPPLPLPPSRGFVSAVSQIPPSSNSPFRPIAASATATSVQPPVSAARPSSASTTSVLAVPPVPRPIQLQSSFPQVSVTPRWPSLPQFQPFLPHTHSPAILLPPPIPSIRPVSFPSAPSSWPALESHHHHPPSLQAPAPAPAPASASAPAPAPTFISPPQAASREGSLPAENTYPPEPPKPSDPEMLKNIDVLAAFVVKNGPPFESMARARQAGDPKFSFLFDSYPSPEASIGHTYYNWKKQVLALDTKKESSKKVELQKSGDTELLINPIAGRADSPVVSDMDMEDDVVPSEPVRRKQLENVRLDTGDTMVMSGFSGVSKFLDKGSSPDADLERHALLQRNNQKSQNHFLNPRLESQSKVCVLDIVNMKEKMLERCDNGSNVKIVSHDWEPPDEATNKPKEHDDNAEVSQGSSSVSLINRTYDQSIVHTQHSYQHDASSLSADNSEGKQMNSKRETEILYDYHHINVASKLPSIPVKPPLGLKEDEYSKHVIRNGGMNEQISEQKGSLDGGPADAAHPLTQENVDEFGRLFKKGESDPEGKQWHRKRNRSFSRSRSRSRTSSRSISRSPSQQSRRNVYHSPSPEQLRRRSRLSPSPARRRRRRRSPSWSQSPPPQSRCNRSPSKDTKWGAELERRNEDNSYALERRGEKGNGSDLCFHYARGRCFRGNACRFVHPDRETVEKCGVSFTKNGDVQQSVVALKGCGAGCESCISNCHISPQNSSKWKPEVCEAWSAHWKEKNSHLEMQNNEIQGQPASETCKGFKTRNSTSISLKEFDGIKNVDKGLINANHEDAKTIGISEHKTETNENATVVERNLDVDVTGNPELHSQSKFSKPDDHHRNQLNVNNTSSRSASVCVQESSSFDQNIDNHQIFMPAPFYQQPNTMRHHPHSGSMIFNSGSSCTSTKLVHTPIGISNPLTLSKGQEPGPMDMSSAPCQSCPEYLAGPYQYGPQHASHVSYQDTTYAVSQNSYSQGTHQGSVLPDATSQHFVLQRVVPHSERNSESGQCGFSGNPFSQRGDFVHHSIRNDISKELITPHQSTSSQYDFVGASHEKQLSSYSYSLTTIPPLNLPDGLKIHTYDRYGPTFHGIAPGVCSKKATVMESLENVSPALESDKTIKFTDESEADNVRAEVGLVENVSPAGICSVAQSECGAEVGSYQGKSQNKKNVRGLKLLQTAVADHVKTLLKPIWREGRMSKESYKTIVKKAVEKVTGSLPSHHIPKSQEKVEHFIAVSKPKISKLVKGYVDKYIKL